MSLLTIARAVATNVSAAIPASIMSRDSPDNQKIIRFTEEAANEVVRRVDWGALRASETITGTGTNDNFQLPTGFSRLIEGNAIKSGAAVVRVGLSPDEWNSLTPVVGTPRYARLNSGSISFFPFLANAATVTVTYQTKNWLTTGNVWADDSSNALVPEELISMGAIWRWRRHAGQDYQDHLAEFEAALVDLSKFDGGVRSP